MNAVRTAQGTHHFSPTQTNRLMLFIILPIYACVFQAGVLTMLSYKIRIMRSFLSSHERFTYAQVILP
jgi:hypothetical protein